MHNWIMLGSAFLAGVCTLGCILAIRDVPRAEADAKQAEELEAARREIEKLQREASSYAQAWKAAKLRRTPRSALGARLAQSGGNSAA